MGRRPCCSKEGLNRGAWTSLEDQILTKHMKAHGEGNWRNLPKRAGLKRCGKSCRLRWLNYLRPDIKRGNISRDEEDLIVRLHNLLGNRWSLIAGRLPGRTDNEIKNYWNTNLAKKAKAQASSSRNRSSPHDEATTQPQIIHTKATRCTKVVVTAAAEVAHLPENDDVHVHSLSSTEMDPSDPQEKQHHQEPHYGEKMDHITHHEQEGVAQMSCDLGFWNFDHHGSDDTVGADNNLSSMEAHDQVLLMDMPFLEDWAANNCLEDHSTATFDLESLAFLLGSGEWPCGQESQS